MDGLLEYAAEWAERYRASSGRGGVEVGLERSGADRDKPSLWIDFERAGRMVRLILWVGGEAVLAVGEVDSGRVLPEQQLTIEGTAALEAVLGRAVALVSDR